MEEEGVAQTGVLILTLEKFQLTVLLERNG